MCVASFFVSQASPANPKCCSTAFSSTGVSAQRDIVRYCLVYIYIYRHASTCTILNGFKIMYHGSKRCDSNWSGQILHGSRKIKHTDVIPCNSAGIPFRLNGFRSGFSKTLSFIENPAGSG